MSVGIRNGVVAMMRWIIVGVLGAVLLGCATGPDISPAPSAAASSSYNYIIGPR